MNRNNSDPKAITAARNEHRRNPKRPTDPSAPNGGEKRISYSIVYILQGRMHTIMRIKIMRREESTAAYVITRTPLAGFGGAFDRIDAKVESSRGCRCEMLFKG